MPEITRSYPIKEISDLIPLGSPLTWEPFGNGAPFVGYVGMVEFLGHIQKQNDDAVILIDGPEGAGKSTVAFQLATALDKNWNPETGLIIDFKDWEEMYALEQGRVFVLDEGGDLLFSRDSMQGENKLVVRIFQMARIFNHVIIICCPNIHWVDLYIRNHRTLIYGHVHKEYFAGGVRRGLVVWHWADRRFDWANSEWTIRWNIVVYSYFKAIPKTFKKWINYETLKRLKVQNRQNQLTQGLRRK